jgi:hypothetical protein
MPAAFTYSLNPALPQHATHTANLAGQRGPLPCTHPLSSPHNAMMQTLQHPPASPSPPSLKRVPAHLAGSHCSHSLCCSLDPRISGRPSLQTLCSSVLLYLTLANVAPPLSELQTAHSHCAVLRCLPAARAVRMFHFGAIARPLCLSLQSGRPFPNLCRSHLCNGQRNSLLLAHVFACTCLSEHFFFHKRGPGPSFLPHFPCLTSLSDCALFACSALICLSRLPAPVFSRHTLNPQQVFPM